MFVSSARLGCVDSESALVDMRVINWRDIEPELEHKPSSVGKSRASLFDEAHCFEVGLGVEKHVSKALRLYLLASEQGHAEAAFRCGYLYESGIGRSL